MCHIRKYILKHYIPIQHVHGLVDADRGRLVADLGAAGGAAVLAVGQGKVLVGFDQQCLAPLVALYQRVFGHDVDELFGAHGVEADVLHELVCRWCVCLRL